MSPQTFKPNDIVRVRKLDLSKYPKPEDKDQAKLMDGLLERMRMAEGKAMMVLSTQNVDGTECVSMTDGVASEFEIGSEKYSVTFLPSELELLETDWINNCCEERGALSERDGVCDICGFGAEDFLRRLSETKTEKASEKK
jgi:hypothetical protein